MMHDLFIPCRIGNYYLHTKKILTLEITPVVVYGVLFEYSAQKITLKEKYSVSLKENNSTFLTAAIKKIVSSAGKVDEIISTNQTSAMIFKELKLPFLGRESIEMVLPLEIENMLPFPLDQAVIDFIVINQDLQKKVSTVLTCAVRKQDIGDQYEIFKKADVSLDMLTVDIFALYRLYTIYTQQNNVEEKSTTSKDSLLKKLSEPLRRLHALVLRKKHEDNVNYSEQILQNLQAQKSEVLVDIGYNNIKVLYIKDGVLNSVRIIPFGVGTIFEAYDDQSEKLYDNVMHSLKSEGPADLNVVEQFKKIFEEISRTLLYFQQQQETLYITPSKISFTGFFSYTSTFIAQAKNYFGSIVVMPDMQECLTRALVTNSSKINITTEYFNTIASGLLWHYQKENNLLKEIAEKKEQRTATVQLIVMFLVSILSIGTIWWRSSEQIQRWQTAYNASRKQLVAEIQNQMGLDLFGQKNLKTLVDETEKVLKRERQLWFSFTQQNEASILEYLQDLSVAIDREAIHLELKSLHIDYQKIVMTGSVKSFEDLDLFYEELQELKLLKLVDRPRELSWTIELKPKSILKGAL